MHEVAGRQVGVRLSDGQLSAGTAPEKTIVHIARAEMVAICYGDEMGKAHNVVLLKVGDVYYFPPNAEAWAGQLKPAADWLVKELKQKMVDDNGPVPMDDAVSVIAGDVVGEIG